MKKTKKVGILTHYHQSTNYGGILQAYALCKAINKIKGLKAEQINYIFYPYEKIFKDNDADNNSTKNKPYKISFISKIKGYVSSILFSFKTKQTYDCNDKNSVISYVGNSRAKAFANFYKKTPSSKFIYDKTNIDFANNSYDIFVSGSDQVWNLNWYNKAFFLEFKDKDKIGISYAASVGMHDFKAEQKIAFDRGLKNFYAISVREQSAKSLIEKHTDKEVSVTLDPTLLLSKEDWDEVTSKRFIKSEYIFCYFLGSNTQAGELAKQYARLNNCKLVSLPYLSSQSVFGTEFGDITPFNVGPEKFLSLIKYAKCVFTDSFHATVFSNIFNKEFFVFNRYLDDENLNARISQITSFSKTLDRYCYLPERKNLDYINSLPPIDFSAKNNAFEEELMKSKEFLIKNLKS